MRLRAALLLASLAAAAPSHAACPQPREVRQQDMLGAWRAEIAGHGSAELVLSRHPEYGGSFTGMVRRAGQPRARVAGDIDIGQFTLEESIDGTRVSATWLGEVVEGSCGREIRGTWQADGDDAPIVPFVLKKR